MSTETGWYFESLGETQGPLTAKQMQALSKKGAIEPLTMVKRGVSGDWVRAETVKGFDFGAAPVAEPEASIELGPPTIPTRPVVERPVVERPKGLIAPPAKRSTMAGVIALIVQMFFAIILTVTVCWFLFSPRTGRFDGDNAIGATANVLERMETMIMAIFAFSVAAYIMRSINEAFKARNGG
jgi:hypothetical protein